MARSESERPFQWPRKQSTGRALCLVAETEVRRQADKRGIHRQNSQELAQEEGRKRETASRLAGWPQTRREQGRGFAALFANCLCLGI